MRLKPVAVAFALLLTVGLVSAPAAAAVEPADEDAEVAIETYNEKVDEVPEVVRDRFADERVVVTVEKTGEEDLVYTVVTNEDAEVVEVEEGAHDPTITATTDEETLEEIAESDDPRATADEAYESGDIQVEGVGITNTVKVEALKLGYDIACSMGLV